MKIALVARHICAPAAPSNLYAAEQAEHVADLGRALAAQGHKVVIYGRKDAPGLPDRETLATGLTARYIKAGPPAPVPAGQLHKHVAEIARYLSAQWRKETPDIVHAHHWTSGLAALAATRDLPVPVVQTFGSLGLAEQRHGVPGPIQSVRIRMETAVARSVAGVLAVTTDEAAEMAGLGVPGSKVKVVPCGADTNRFDPHRLRSSRRADLRLLHVGPFAEHAGLSTLLKSLPDLPGTELVVAGGPDQDELESDIAYKKLDKLAAGLGVANRVTFTGHVAAKNLPALMSSADLYVSAARYEPYGAAAIRAMACGKPVVANAVGSHADAVVDGTTGLLATPGRPEVLVRRLRDLLATPVKIMAFGIAAADRARSRYSWERIAAETVAVYERCQAGQATAQALAGAPEQAQRAASRARQGQAA
jgi:glycosyltransferase involved in cell wall biosynthesis